MKSFQMPVTCRMTATTKIGSDIGSMIDAEDAPEAGAVDARRLEQLDRQRREVVAEEQRHDRHAEDRVDDDDAGERVVDADREKIRTSG